MNKLFLRGFGTGLILASIILCISYRAAEKDHISKLERDFLNKHITAVESKSVEVTADDLLLQNQMQNASGAAVEADSDAEQTKDADADVDQAKESDTAKEAEAEKEPVATPEAKKVVKTQNLPSVSGSDNNKNERGEKILSTSKQDLTKDKDSLSEAERLYKDKSKVKIKTANSSMQVAVALQKAGVIKDAGDFNMYLTEHGYEKKVRAGDFKIPKDAGFEKIAKIVTGG